MRVQFSKKLQTTAFEPSMFFLELTAEDFGIQLDGDVGTIALTAHVLLDQAQKAVWKSMHASGLVPKEEYDKAVEVLLPEATASDYLAVLQKKNDEAVPTPE